MPSITGKTFVRYDQVGAISVVNYRGTEQPDKFRAEVRGDVLQSTAHGF